MIAVERRRLSGAGFRLPQDLRAVLAEFVRYYNVERPHRALALETPTPAVRAAAGPISSRPVLGGLHHSDQRAA